MRICSRAVEIDPYYADAWALLAIAQSSLRYGFGREIDDGFAAANAALSIDPDIPQAHLPMVKRLQQRGNDAKRPPRWQRRSAWAGFVGGEQGGGTLLPLARDIPTATRHYEKAVELVESDFHAWAMLSTCYQALGDNAKVRETAQEDGLRSPRRAVQQDPSNGAALGILAGGYALLGESEKAQRMDRAGAAGRSRESQHALQFRLRSRRYHGRQRRRAEDAAKRLAGLAGEHSGAASPRPITDLDPLRDDPRFEELARRERQDSGSGIAELDWLFRPAPP